MLIFGHVCTALRPAHPLSCNRLPLVNTPLSAQVSPVAIVAPSRYASSLVATAAADKLLQKAGVASTRAVKAACCAAGAGCSDHPAQDPSVSSQASTSSSSSGCFPGGSESSSSAEQSDSSCHNKFEGPPGCLATPVAPLGVKQHQALHAQHQASKPPCPCKPRKVSFDCAALQLQQQRKGMSVCMAALSAAAAHTGAERAHARQQGRQAQLRTSSPGFAHAAAGCCAGCSGNGTAAEPSQSEGAHASVAKQLNLLPALSEPVLVEVQSQPGSSHSGSGAGDACCCCSSPRRTTQSGTCSAAVAAAAGRPRPQSVHLVAATAAAHALPCGGDSGCAGCAGGCAQAEQAFLSAPAHTAALQTTFSGPAPRSLGTLTGFNSARRVALLGQHSSAGLPPVDVSGGAAGMANRVAGQAKPPLLKASSIAAMPAQPAGGAPSPKAMLFSPPKPIMLMQRLRSMTHRERRRHSFDLAAVSAAPAVAPAAAASPGGISEAAAGNSLPAAAGLAPELPSPHRQKVRSGTGAGLASPLAALSKLSGFLSPPSTVRSQGASVPCPGRNASVAVPAGQAGIAAAQHGTAGAEGGTAALMVGLTGNDCAEMAAWEVQESAGGRVSPSQGCRSAKDVCMKVGLAEAAFPMTSCLR